ncbi:MAG: hypothetical protein KUG77_24575 [Nannocystaceae bacterium]|nr:hypothetical protein [Nannocystaceae bacterium]
MSTSWARPVLGGLAALATLELVLGGLSYRDAIDDSDWDALAGSLTQDDADAVRLATTWLGPRARMEVPKLAAPRSAAAPDLHGLETLSVVGLGESWSDALDQELEGQRRPSRLSEETLGPFKVGHYRFEHAPSTLRSWISDPPTLSTPQGSCRKKRSSWACKEGSVSVGFAEVNYTPRRCFQFALSDNTPLTFEDTLPLGTSLRGHLGVTDFNSRLRSDAPIRIRTFVDEVAVGSFTVTDAQGWRPFSVKTEPGEHHVRIELTDTVQGTWGREGHNPRGHRKVCFELRVLGGGS